MKKCFVFLLMCVACCTISYATEHSSLFQYSVELKGYVSSETGKAPSAYLWIPDGCEKVKAVVFAQQNMTEEMLYKNEPFQHRMKQLNVALLWVAPAFTNSWNPASGCQEIFDAMLTDMACESGHAEIEFAPIIPFGHSAQATMPWNFAAWNPNRTLCVISFHGDAPRTNLCGYGSDNVEWGRNRNIDGIPGLMIEGEYEWWEARVRPALAFRMMYPNSCVSFLCDAGSGHFELMPETAEYIALFIEKSIEQRVQDDGTLKRLHPHDGWLACRYNPDLPPNDGDGEKDDVFFIAERPKPAAWGDYQGDHHDAFWYFDEEMALITEARYAETRNKRVQTVGFVYENKLVRLDPARHGGMSIDLVMDENSPLTFHLSACFVDDSHAVKPPHIEVICGPVRKVNDDTFQIYPYECGMDNPRRSFTAWLVAIADGDENYKRAVQPIEIHLPREIVAYLE